MSDFFLILQLYRNFKGRIKFRNFVTRDKISENEQESDKDEIDRKIYIV